MNEGGRLGGNDRGRGAGLQRAHGTDSLGDFVGGVGSIEAGKIGRGSGGSSSSSRRGRNRLIILILDTKLRRVLILARSLNHQHQTVVRGIGLEILARRPFVRTRVGNTLSHRVDGLDVGAGAAQEDERDGTLGCGVPLDGVGLAGGDALVLGGLGDGIAGGGLGVVWFGVGRGQGNES